MSNQSKKIKIPTLDKVLTSLVNIVENLDKRSSEQLAAPEVKTRPVKINGNLHHLTEESWQAYSHFLQTLDNGVEEYRKTQINNFWREYEMIKKDEQNLLSWIDPETLDIAKKKVLEHKDKQHTHCFDDLILYKRPLAPSNFSLFDELDKELPNFKNVTSFYRGAFALNYSRDVKSYKSPKPILLLGNPGIGKTHYAKKLAKLLGTSYRFFDSNSITGGWVLSGNNATWRGADAGLIFTEMAKSETLSPIVLLDEIDKINGKHEYSPFSTFHQLFESENAKTFFDEFVNVSFDASQIIYILTANEAKNIAPSLLSRMTVFNIDNPSPEDMRSIIQSIYTNLMDGSKLFTKKLADSEVDKLVKFSPREVTQILSNNIYDQASKKTLENKISGQAKRLIVDISRVSKQNNIGF